MIVVCKEASELHTAAEEGALTGAKKALYDLHMTICGPCKRYRQQLRTTAEVVKSMPHEDAAPPADLLDLLAKEIDKKV
jgi:hypothetical protein